MLLIRVGGAVALSAEERARIGPDSDAWAADLEARGARVLGGPLARAADAATVRVRDGGLAVTEGPADEDAEPISGFEIVDCDGLAEAIEIAARHPVAQFGAIELRPFADA